MEAVGKLLDFSATPRLCFLQLRRMVCFTGSVEVRRTGQGCRHQHDAEQRRGGRSIISAFLEVFDRIYTSTLWSKRAFGRSMLLTIVAVVATLPIMSRLIDMLPSGLMPELSKYEMAAVPRASSR